MKTLLLLFLLILSAKPSNPLLLLDTTMRKPAKPATEFSPVQYLQHHFPVYAEDVPDLVRAADDVVKKMEKGSSCHRTDTVATAHSLFLLLKDCKPVQNISVMLLTKIEGTGTTYSYNLVVKEENRRRAQQRVLDFATYIVQ